MSETEEIRLRQRLAEVTAEIEGPPPQTRQALSSPEQTLAETYSTSPIMQAKIARAVEIEFLENIVNEMAMDESWDELLSNPDLKYFNYVPFDSDIHFLDRRGNSGILVLAACSWQELVGFEESLVPAWIPAKANVAALEVVEKAVGTMGMRIAVAGGGSEYHVRQMRQGRMNVTPMVSNRDIQKVDRIWDVGYVSQRLIDKVIESERKIFALEEQLVDSRQAAFVIGEKFYESKTLGKGGARIGIPLKYIAAAVVVAIIAIAIIYLLAKGI